MIYEVDTEDDYQKALIRFLEICKEPKNNIEVKEMYLLMDLMSRYERENCSEN
jgi:hypothetical protein